MVTVSTEDGEFKFGFQYYEHNKKRGVTCTVVQPNGLEIVGSSICAKEDNFNKATGRKIALARAIEPLDKNVRTAIWNEYLIFHKVV